jgi:hypothetical protein
VSGKGILVYVVFEGSIMSELQPLSSIFPLAQIERPACPKCQGNSDAVFKAFGTTPLRAAATKERI